MVRFLKRMIVLLVILSIVAGVGVFLFRQRYQQVILHLAETQVKNATSDLINDAIDRQIELGNIHYDRIVYFEKDLDGRITALKTNMSEVNRLKTDILNLINDEILAVDTADLVCPWAVCSCRNFCPVKVPVSRFRSCPSAIPMRRSKVISLKPVSTKRCSRSPWM